MSAGAAPSASLHVTPDTVPAGGQVQVSGTCEANTSGFGISPAFLHDPTHDFAGVGAVPFETDGSGNFSVPAQIPATRAPGTYQVTARCGGGNLGIEVTLTVTAASAPTAVPAGSGGLVATTSTHDERQQQILLGLGVALLAISGAAIVRRRRTAR